MPAAAGRRLQSSPTPWSNEAGMPWRHCPADVEYADRAEGPGVVGVGTAGVVFQSAPAASRPARRCIHAAGGRFS